MLNFLLQFFDRLIKVAFVVLMTVFLALGGVWHTPQAIASGKVAPAEALELAISEAAQEFVDSILDDYSDVLEDTFEGATDPLKAAVKDVTKQLSKAEKAASKASGKSSDEEGEGSSPAPEIAIDPTAFETAATSFGTLTEEVERFKAQLEGAPAVIQAMIQTQLGSKLDELEQSFASISEAVDQLAEQTGGIQASDPASTAAFTEQAALLNQSVEAVDLIIDSFDS